MITMYSDHTLNSSGQTLLKLVQAAPSTVEQVATKVPYPIARVRLSLTELKDAKLLTFKDGQYTLTDAGLLRITE